MYFAQHYLDCLSQASYLIGDETTGEAIIVDPRRDIAEYLSDAADHNLHIVGVINTHFHADFLSGHLEMAKATGAWIGYGQGARAEFPIRSLADGERITLGQVTLEKCAPFHRRRPEGVCAGGRSRMGRTVRPFLHRAQYDPEMETLRYAAFSPSPDGGNPAGVVLDASGLDANAMQLIAAEIGFSETAFLTPTGPHTATVRYFAPIAEVAFCGHATIAAAVARAERGGIEELTLDSAAGPIVVTTTQTDDGVVATLISVPPVVTEISADVVKDLLAALRLSPADLDPALPVRVSYSGNHHPIVGVPLAVLDRLDYDQPALTGLMANNGWGATVAVVARTGVTEFEARNPFPPGGVREDPATGSAAAALGAYLRATDLVEPPVTVTIRQGRHVGRPGLLTVAIPAGDGGIAVSGRAVPLP